MEVNDNIIINILLKIITDDGTCHYDDGHQVLYCYYNVRVNHNKYV